MEGNETRVQILAGLMALADTGQTKVERSGKRMQPVRAASYGYCGGFRRLS